MHDHFLTWWNEAIEDEDDLLNGRRDDERDLRPLRRDIRGHADPEIIALVAFGGRVDDRLRIHIGGDDGAGLLGGEASDVDLRAIKNPGIEIGRSFALFDVLDEVGERHVVGFIAVFPLAADLEEVGSSGGGRGLVFVSVGALDLGIDFAEDALGGGLVVGQQEGKLNLNGLHRGLEDGFVDFISGLMAEGVLDGKLLVEDAARDAQLTRGGGDLDAVEVENAWRCFLEQLFSLFELSFRVHLGRGGFLSKQTREEGEEGEG